MKKVNFGFKNRPTALLCIAGLLILISSCTYFQSDRKNREPIEQCPEVQLPSAYLKAVQDAANPEPDEVYHDLLPISLSNTKLVRKTLDGEDYVLSLPWFFFCLCDG